MLPRFDPFNQVTQRFFRPLTTAIFLFLSARRKQRLPSRLSFRARPGTNRLKRGLGFVGGERRKTASVTPPVTPNMTPAPVIVLERHVHGLGFQIGKHDAGLFNHLDQLCVVTTYPHSGCRRP